MIEITLYILTGMAVYGGIHHLYLAAASVYDTPYIHVLLATLYILLSTFCLTSALSYRPLGITTLVPLGKLNIAAGILMWTALIGFVARFTQFRPRVVLAGLAGAWAVLLIRNIVSPNSLLYAAITPHSHTLPSGEVYLSWQPVISHWWTALELTVFASLVFSLYSGYRLFRAGQQLPALVLIIGLGVLTFTSVLDVLVSKQVIQSSYFAPFGFVVFLGILSMHLIRQQQHNRQSATVSNYANYNLTLNIAPETKEAGSDAADLETSGSMPLAANVSQVAQAIELQTPAAPKLDDEGLLKQVSERLADISVYSAIALHRIKRGELEARSMEMLCKRVQSQVLNARRLTNSLCGPEKQPATDDRQRPGS